MDKTSIILSALLGAALVLMLAPGVFAMNRGRVLRNVALWLAIILATALAYRLIGSGRQSLAPQQTPLETPQKASDAKRYQPTIDSPAEDEDDGDQGYTPPKE